MEADLKSEEIAKPDQKEFEQPPLEPPPDIYALEDDYPVGNTNTILEPQSHTLDTIIASHKNGELTDILCAAAAGCH